MNDSLQQQVGRIRNKDFSEAVTATCALIAAADGNISAEERQKTAGFIASNPALSHFDVVQLQERFSYYCTKLSGDFDFGKIEALQVIGKLKRKEELARTLIQLGIVIGAADGDFDDDEKKVVREICHAVGVDPVQFDL